MVLTFLADAYSLPYGLSSPDPSSVHTSCTLTFIFAGCWQSSLQRKRKSKPLARDVSSNISEVGLDCWTPLRVVAKLYKLFGRFTVGESGRSDDTCAVLEVYHQSRSFFWPSVMP